MFFWASGGRSKANVLNLFSFPISLSGLYYYPALSVFGELFFSDFPGKHKSFLSFRLGGFSFSFFFYWVLGVCVGRCAFDELGWAVFIKSSFPVFSLLHACGRMVGCLSLFFRFRFEDTLFFFLSFLMLFFFFV